MGSTLLLFKKPIYDIYKNRNLNMTQKTDYKHDIISHGYYYSIGVNKSQ